MMSENSTSSQPTAETQKDSTVLVQTIFVILAGLMAAFVVFGYMRRARSIDQKIPKTTFTVPKFSLTDQDGNAFGSKDLDGKIWVAGFIFTRCSGPCPIVSGRMARLFNDPGLKELTLVSISVDPEHDKPTVLSSYGLNYSAQFQRWHFLTGDKKPVYDLIFNGFKVSVQEATDVGIPIGEKFAHTTRLVLVDGKGHIRGYYDSLDDESLKRLRTHANLLIRRKQLPGGG